ncbi:H/ACA ribonucleoprotein complex non-core subunit NAF1 [Hemicordylus capensis]|uniref:H/ACA ribonucleoprotein complex non-core subunit NAF1 n=1 Tax=Hemicordylus capensis TaxID=884348 RepID=UPI0023049674|nr:H/ACA ribonucleoprotein complex non-core subunit NAF1 [Hemicordylus capensis]
MEDATMEGSGSSSETSDSDTDSSSSTSSSSCLPMLSDEDVDQQTTEKVPLPKEPVEDVNIILPESVELMYFGKVSSIIEHLVIIESLKGLPPVNEDTVLFKEDHHSIGKIFEVFGPVSHPFYVLQFNGPEHIETKGLKMDESVYFAPSVESFTQYIFPEKIKQEKGSDASWKEDDEPPPEAVEFSDDEKERAAKQKKKHRNARRKKFRSQDESNGNGGGNQPRRQYSADYSRGYPSREHNPSFSTSTLAHPSVPQCLSQEVKPPQQYSADCTELQKPSACCHHQRPENPSMQQYSFPPPSFGTVNNEVNHFPPLSAIWGWPCGFTQPCTGLAQNIYDPLLSLLALPPPPPPPSPPPSSPPNNANPP